MISPVKDELSHSEAPMLPHGGHGIKTDLVEQITKDAIALSGSQNNNRITKTVLSTPVKITKSDSTLLAIGQ